MAEPDDEVFAAHREYVRYQHEMSWKRFRSALGKLPEPSVITFREELDLDQWGTVTLGEWGGYLIQIMSMIFNDRLVLTPKTATWGHDFGWCYDKGGAAGLAALVWNPQTEGEPVGFKKRASAGVRQPGQQADPADREWMGELLTKLLAP